MKSMGKNLRLLFGDTDAWYVRAAGDADDDKGKGNDKKQFSLAWMSAPPGQTTAPFTVDSHDHERGQFDDQLVQSSSLTGLTVVGVKQPDVPATATFTDTSVSVKNMHPLKSGESLTVTISREAPAATAMERGRPGPARS